MHKINTSLMHKYAHVWSQCRFFDQYAHEIAILNNNFTIEIFRDRFSTNLCCSESRDWG